MGRLKHTKYLFLVFLLFVPFKAIPAKKALKTDTIAIEKLEAPLKTVEKLNKQSAFSYGEPSTAPGFFERLMMTISNWYFVRAISGLSNWIIYGILLSAFVIMVVILFRSKFQGVFLKNREEKSFDFSKSEISDNIDLDNLLEGALQAKNYNMAVRYWYLILLRKLSQKSLINYKPGKTNFEYMAELNNKDLLPQFRTATRNYEYAWYGQFSLNEDTYREIEADYKVLTDKLHD